MPDGGEACVTVIKGVFSGRRLRKVKTDRSISSIMQRRRNPLSAANRTASGRNSHSFSTENGIITTPRRYDQTGQSDGRRVQKKSCRRNIVKLPQCHRHYPRLHQKYTVCLTPPSGDAPRQRRPFPRLLVRIILCERRLSPIRRDPVPVGHDDTDRQHRQKRQLKSRGKSVAGRYIKRQKAQNEIQDRPSYLR